MIFHPNPRPHESTDRILLLGEFPLYGPVPRPRPCGRCRRSSRRRRWKRDPTPEEREPELRICIRDFGSLRVHEPACVRGSALRPDLTQAPRPRETIANLDARADEVKQTGS